MGNGRFGKRGFARLPFVLLGIAILNIFVNYHISMAPDLSPRCSTTAASFFEESASFYPGVSPPLDEFNRTLTREIDFRVRFIEGRFGHQRTGLGKGLPMLEIPKGGDYGGISVERRRDVGGARDLKDDTHASEEFREGFLDGIDATLPTFYGNEDETEEFQGDCLPPSWVSLRFPTCNSVHEVVLNRPRESLRDDLQFQWVGEGTFRQTFLFNRLLRNDRAPLFALKTLLYKSRYGRFLEEQLQVAPIEALILERLTKSPNIVDVYQFCGVTSILEPMPDDISETIQEGRGYADPAVLAREADAYSRNRLKPRQKLSLALGMARALADLHGFSGGAIVHGDNHIEQFLVSPEGKLKLGDFNLATVLRWNHTSGTAYCKRGRDPWRFRFRAPEEIGGIPFDEKIDVFSFGNSLFSLITGLRPFYDDKRGRAVSDQIYQGERGYIDPRHRNHSLIEASLMDLMDQVWEQNADRRIDVFRVVRELEDIRIADRSAHYLNRTIHQDGTQRFAI